MKPQSKIATCSYCGSRTILKLTAREGHELACASCGAPLHEMKALPVRRDYLDERTHQPRKYHARSTKKRFQKPRKRKSIWREGFEEFFDAVEDIFD